MKSRLEIPRHKKLLPWIAGIVVGAAVWSILLFLTDASGTLSVYVGFIVGFNAGAFVAAGIARPIEDADEGFVLDARDELLRGRSAP